VRRGFPALELVTSDELLGARRWEHRLSQDDASIEIELADGRAIHGDAIRGVLNRLLGVSPAQLPGAATADREYASEELYAFFLSWLESLSGRVLNPPSPQGLSGAWLDSSEWLLLAARAGLPTPVYRQGARELSQPSRAGDRRSVLVVGSRALGPPAPPEVVAGCGRLARLAKLAILGLDFRVAAGERWTFVSATPLPALRPGGERLLDLLARALRDAGTPA
jgi:hypothetical protein